MVLLLWSLALQFQLPALLFVCVLFFLVFVVVLSGEPKLKNQGRGLVDRKLVQALRNYIAGRRAVGSSGLVL